MDTGKQPNSGHKMPDDYENEVREKRASGRRTMCTLIIIVAILIIAVIALLVAVIVITTNNNTSCSTATAPVNVHFVTFVDDSLQYEANLTNDQREIDIEIKKIVDAMTNGGVNLTQNPDIMAFEPTMKTSKTKYSLGDSAQVRKSSATLDTVGDVPNPTRVYAVIYTPQEISGSLYLSKRFQHVATTTSVDSSIVNALLKAFGGNPTSEPSVSPNSQMCKLIEPILVTTALPTPMVSTTSLQPTSAKATGTTEYTTSTTSMSAGSTKSTTNGLLVTWEIRPKLWTNFLSGSTSTDATTIATTEESTASTISPTISALVPCSDQIDVVILVDQSGSIADQFEIVKTYVKYLATAWQISPDKAHVAVATFSDNIGQSWTLDSMNGSTTRSAFNTAVDNLIVNPSRTDISSALNWAQTLTTRNSTTKAIILLTDGQQSPEYEAHSRDIPAKELITDGFMILSVVIPDSNGDKNVTEMQQICGTMDNVFEVASIDYLLTDFHDGYEIQDKTCHHPTMTPHSGCYTYTVCNTTTASTTVPTTTVTTGYCDIDLMFLIDHSESINEDTQWPLIKNFVKNITQSFDIGIDRTLVSVTRFATDADIQFCFDNYTVKADLLNAIETLPYDPPGATAIGRGLQMIEDDVIISSCGYRGMKGTLVLITDGGNNLSPDPFPIAASLRTDDDVNIYAVGIQTQDLDVDALINMTGDISRVFIGTYQDLDMFALEISADACATTTTSTTTTAPPTTTCSPGYIDLVYLVDESESITIQNFENEIKPFLTSVTSKVANTTLVGAGGIRVAMAWFSSYLASPSGVEIHGECGVEFYLDQEDTLDDVNMKIQNATYNLGATDTTCGFNIVRNEVFNSSHGEREGSTRVLVVVTDGKPNLGHPIDPSPIAKQMRDDDGVIILTVGVTNEIDRDQLINWTGGHEDQFFNSTNFSGLDDKLANAISDTIDNKTNICPTQPCKMPSFNIAYLVDESESVYEHFGTVKTFLKNITDNVTSLTDDQSQFAMVWFSQATRDHDAAGVEFDWTVGNEATNDKITNAIIHLGATNVYEGMDLVRSSIFDNQNPMLDSTFTNVLIFVSDGAPNLPLNESYGTQIALAQAKEIREEGVTIISIGIDNDELDQAFLEDVAGSLDRVYIAENYDTLGRIIDELVNSLNPCPATSTEPPTSSPTFEPSTTTLITTLAPTPTEATTSTTMPRTTTTAVFENCGVDVAIIVELSDVMDNASCSDAKTSVQTLVNSYDYTYDRVALIPYADYQFGTVCYSQITTATKLNAYIDTLDCGTRNGSDLESALFQLQLDDSLTCGRRSSCKNDVIFIPATNPTSDTNSTAKLMQDLEDNNAVSLFAMPVLQYASDGPALVSFFKEYTPDDKSVREVLKYHDLNNKANDFTHHVLPHPTPATIQSTPSTVSIRTTPAATTRKETTPMITSTSGGTTTTSDLGCSTSSSITSSTSVPNASTSEFIHSTSADVIYVDVYSDLHFVTFIDDTLQYDTKLMTDYRTIVVEIEKIKDALIAGKVAITQDPDIMDFEPTTTTSKAEYSLNDWVRFQERLTIFGKMEAVSNPTRVYAVIYTPQEIAASYFPKIFKTISVVSTDTSIRDALTKVFGSPVTSERSVTPNSEMCKLIEPIVLTTPLTLSTSPSATTQGKSSLSTTVTPGSPTTTIGTTSQRQTPALTTTSTAGRPTPGTTTSTNVVTQSTSTTPQTTPTMATASATTSTRGPIITTTGTTATLAGGSTAPTISPTISALVPCSDEIDVVFLIDQSGSITDKFEIVKTYVKYLATAWEIGPTKANIALATFSNTISQEWILSSPEGSTTRSAFNIGVDNIAVNPSRTDISSALKWAETLTTRNSATKAIIILSDGQQSPEYEANSRVVPAKQLRDDGFMILSVVIPDINGDKDVAEMEQISGNIEDVYEVASVDSLLTDFQDSYEIQDKTCYRPTMPTEPTHSGCYYVCNTTTAPTPTTTVTTGYCHIDLMFLIDHSESIHEHTQWPLIRNFVKNITENFDIGMDKTLVSVTRFAFNADIQFCFDVYTQKADLLNAIETLPYDPPGPTAIGRGLQMIENDVIISSCGYRGMKGTLILITDGGNNMSPEPFPIAASLRNNHDITIYAVGITTPDLDVEALVNMTGDASRVFNGTYQDLDTFAQEISEDACSTCKMTPVNLAYLVDESESVYEHFASVQTFMRNFTDSVTSLTEDRSQFAMVWFSQATGEHEAAGVEFDWTVGSDATDQKVTDAVIRLGATNVFAGMEKLRNNIFNTANPLLDTAYERVVIFISDGAPNLPTNEINGKQVALNSASTMRNTEGVTIISIGINNDELDRPFLENVAGSPDRVYIAESFETLGRIIEELVDSLNPCHV